MNYGNVHLVSLNGQLSNADVDQRQAMADWLVADLSGNNLDWTVVIFRHPPYSKGENHNSDFEQREIDLREVFTPIFEGYGVDAVYGGHAHYFSIAEKGSVVVDATRRTLTSRFIDVNGDVVDEFTIKRRGRRGHR